jgi:hypothetical protein
MLVCSNCSGLILIHRKQLICTKTGFHSVILMINVSYKFKKTYCPYNETVSIIGGYEKKARCVLCPCLCFPVTFEPNG